MALSMTRPASSRPSHSMIAAVRAPSQNTTDKIMFIDGINRPRLADDDAENLHVAAPHRPRIDAPFIADRWA
ncbi:hypothetical protein [Shinella zoogloeoides]|uniref:hypothetical protein n=1 Tax=Shinella zoogloeoides TaxID=352475 RepID=UPI00299CEB87|nr:hypothetical protein [Shinella zoogloeoides]